MNEEEEEEEYEENYDIVIEKPFKEEEDMRKVAYKRNRLIFEEKPKFDPSNEDTFIVNRYGSKPMAFVSLLYHYIIEDSVIWRVKDSNQHEWNESQVNLIPTLKRSSTTVIY